MSRLSPTNGAGPPVDAGALAAAKAAFEGRERGNVAELVFDSLIDSDDPPSDHYLRFEHARLTVQVQVSVEVDHTMLSVQVHPDLATRVALARPRRAGLVGQGDQGTVRFGPTGHGLVRVSVDGQSSADTVWTDWFWI